MTLHEQTEVGVAQSDVGLESLRVARGTVRCVVPKLGSERQFSVVTPDATVVVHGTVFTVRFNEEAKRTCVGVEEGVVSVRHASGKTWLEAGESWGCEPTPPPETSATRRPR